MTRALTPAELQALDRGLLLGTQREPLAVPAAVRRDDDPHPEQAALAWAAQQRALTARPARRPSTVEEVAAPDDPRPILPEAWRPAWRRLVVAALAHKAPDLLDPVARLIEARGHRLHPFDVADLLRTGVASLPVGPFERWLLAQEGREPTPTLGAQAIDDADWAALTPATRAWWLRQRRARDAAAARALLEACWSGEKADVRARLLEALAVGLSAEDAPFLEAARGDRSAKVRDEAGRLLAAIPGEGPRADVLDALRAVLVVRRSLLGLGAPRLALVAGAEARAHAVTAWLAATDPVAVAEALGGPPEALLRAEDAAAPLLPWLAVGALRHGRPALLAALVAEADRRGLPVLDAPWLEALDPLPPEARRAALAPLLAGPLPRALAARPDLAARWRAALDGPLPPEASAAMRAATIWAVRLDALADAEARDDAAAGLLALAPLVAAEDAAAAHDQLAARGPSALPLLQQLWRLLADLHAALPEPPSPDRSAP